MNANNHQGVLRGLAVLTLCIVSLSIACEREAQAPPEPVEPVLSLAEQAAKDRIECQTIATAETGFDPLTAEAPNRTITTTSRRGGDVVGSGAVAGGAARGAAAGAIGGAIMGDAGTGAAAGAAIGALFGGARRHRETNEMVTHTETNPQYTAYLEAKSAFRASFESCFAARAAAAGVSP